MIKAAPRMVIAGTGSGCGKTTTVCAILQALKKILTDPSYKANAVRISDSFRACGGAGEARAFVEEIGSKCGL